MPRWMYAELQPCGTTAAYDRHIRHREPPCRPCREANARRWRDKHPAAKPKPKPKPPSLDELLEARIDGAAGPGTVSRYLLDICEAVEGPPPEWMREAGAA